MEYKSQILTHDAHALLLVHLHLFLGLSSCECEETQSQQEQCQQLTRHDPAMLLSSPLQYCFLLFEC